MLKKITLPIVFLLGLSSLNASANYEEKLDTIFPLKIQLNDTCNKVKMIVPEYNKTSSDKTFSLYGNDNNFIISCSNKDNKVFKINLYKNSYFSHLGLSKKMEFKKIFNILKSQFKPHLLHITEGNEYKLLEVFVNSHIYQIIVYNKNKKQIDFMSFINTDSFNEYKYIEKVKNKNNIPPLITWLFN